MTDPKSAANPRLSCSSMLPVPSISRLGLPSFSSGPVNGGLYVVFFANG